MSMPSDQLVRLIQAHLDGQLTHEDLVRLNACLRNNPRARDLYLEMADAHSCLAVDEHLWAVAENASPRPVSPADRPRGLTWPPSMAAAAGIVLGMFCTSMLFAYVAPSFTRIKTIFVESFEAGAFQTIPGIPREVGVWAGDEAESVGPTEEVRPLSGRGMLRFIQATHLNENSPRSQWGDVYRIIDLASVSNAPDLCARVSASFASGKNPETHTFSCTVQAILLDEELHELPQNMGLAELQQRSCATASRRLPLPETPGSWREVSIEVPLTRTTRYMVLHLAVDQNQPALAEGAVRFPHHYVDDVKISVLHRH